MSLGLAMMLVFAAASLGSRMAGEAASPRRDDLLRDLDLTPRAGNPLPFNLTGLDDRPHSVADLKGRAALLYFWATW